MEESDFSDDSEMGGEAGQDDLDPNNPEHVFPIIERNFNKTMVDIEQNPESAQFADDFYKLFDNLFHTHQNEEELQRRCSALEAELQAKVTKLDLAMQVTESDQKTIADLKEQIERAWQLADAAHCRELDAQDIINNLRKQVQALTAEIEFKSNLGEDPVEELGEMSKRHEGLERENEKLMGEIAQLTQKLSNAMEYQSEIERQNSTTNLRIVEIAEQLEETSQEINKYMKIKDKLESDISLLQDRIEDRDVLVNNLNGLINGHTKHIGRLEVQIKDERVAKEKTAKELEAVGVKYAKLQEDYAGSLLEIEEVKKKLLKKVGELKTHEQDIARIKAEIAQQLKTKDILEKKIFALETERNVIVDDRNKLRTRIADNEKEIETFKKHIDRDKRTIEAVLKEKDILGKNILKQEAVVLDQQRLIIIQGQSKKKLEEEIESLLITNNKIAKTVNSLERERDRLAEDQIELTQKIENIMDDVKLKKIEIYDLKKSVSEQESKYKMQQNLLEAIRADRNALQKAIQESSSQAGELKKKIKITIHQIEQLKEDISMKEQQIIKQENVFKKVVKERENLKIDLNLAIENSKALKIDIVELKDEEKRLHKAILGHERTILDQRNDLEQLMNERDLLGSQLVRRNDEIALLHEKIRIFQSTLQRGESQYQQRLEDIKLLKIEIKRLRQEKSLLAKTMNNTVDLRQEVLLLERDLTKAQLKCRALEDELQNPLNIHRWRKLEGSDPQAMDLIQKIQLLQKRLLKQSSDAIEREKQLKEVETLYLNLKKLLAHQPGPAIQEELAKTQKALRIRGDKLKCLVSELNMAELHASEYKSDLQRVSDELHQLKQKFFAEKKAQRPQKRAYVSSQELNRVHRQPSEQAKYAGGGFRMSVQSLSNNC